MARGLNLPFIVKKFVKFTPNPTTKLQNKIDNRPKIAITFIYLHHKNVSTHRVAVFRIENSA